MERISIQLMLLLVVLCNRLTKFDEVISIQLMLLLVGASYSKNALKGNFNTTYVTVSPLPEIS